MNSKRAAKIRKTIYGDMSSKVGKQPPDLTAREKIWLTAKENCDG